MKDNENCISARLIQVMDEHLGALGAPKRDTFEEELRLDLLGKAIKDVRLQRNLTQQQLGELVGVQKAHTFKLENSLTDARFETAMKIFKALDATVHSSVEM